MAKKDVDGLMNEPRCFMIYENLYKSIQQFIEDGDGYHVTGVFKEDIYPDSDLVDVSMINFVKLLSTAFGMCHLNEATAIAQALELKRVKKHPLKFRSRHPLYADGSALYQNACLISGMIQLNVPILPYYDGMNVLIDLDPSLKIEVDTMTIDQRPKKN